jgi:transcriptional regulator with XRE-family HTH domain
MLDYSKVGVKPRFLQSFGVPGIRHYEAICDEIIRLLRQERKRRKLSNYVVAQRSGVSESMLSLVERGLRNPTLELTLRIADGIGADLPALIKKATATVRKERGKFTSTRKPGGTADS